jgi:hypothetical protein
MNKTTLILVALSGAVGFALVWFIGFNPITIITNFATNPIESLNSLTTTLTQHWQILASGLTGFAGAFTIFSKVYGKMKSTKQEAENLLQGQVIEANRATAKVEGQVDGYKETLSQQAVLISTKDTEIAKLKEANLAKDGQIQRLNNDLSYGQKAEKDWVKQYVDNKTRKK